MNRQFADQAAHRVGPEIEIALATGRCPIGSGARKCAGGKRRLACVSQCAISVFRCSRQQTLFMSFCAASEECQERILSRSSHRFSTTRNHPLWRTVSSPQTEQGGRFDGEYALRNPSASLWIRTSVQPLAKRWPQRGSDIVDLARAPIGTVSIPRVGSKRRVK